MLSARIPNSRVLPRHPDAPVCRQQAGNLGTTSHTSRLVLWSGRKSPDPERRRPGFQSWFCLYLALPQAASQSSSLPARQTMEKVEAPAMMESKLPHTPTTLTFSLPLFFRTEIKMNRTAYHFQRLTRMFGSPLFPRNVF